MTSVITETEAVAASYGHTHDFYDIGNGPHFTAETLRDYGKIEWCPCGAIRDANGEVLLPKADMGVKRG